MSAQPLTPAQRVLRARAAATARWSKVPIPDRADATKAARDRFDARFEREVDALDPDGRLSPEDRERQKAACRSAYFASLAYGSSRSRSTA